MLTEYLEYLKGLFEILRQAPHGTATSLNNASVTCNVDGAPPMTTVNPVTIRPYARDGRVLSFDQEGVTRYACLNLPADARKSAADRKGRKWPLIIYLHGSRATPSSVYTFGHNFFALHDSYPLSSDPSVRGFILLSPEGRRAMPSGALSGTGFHWDEWYRSSSSNLDALAVDHFLDEVLATGLIDTRRIYVFGWSNGAYMAALYGIWRSDRIAGIAQYAGADPWSRTPCPVPLVYKRQVPTIILRNLCDALVPYATTSEWIQTLAGMSWPFVYHSLNIRGAIVAPDTACDTDCSKIKGLFSHIRWPNKEALQEMLRFLKENPLPEHP